MKCRIEVDMDNAAFIDNGRRWELDRVINLGTLQIKETGNQVIILRDTNGNPVGELTIEED